MDFSIYLYLHFDFLLLLGSLSCYLLGDLVARQMVLMCEPGPYTPLVFIFRWTVLFLQILLDFSGWPFIHIFLCINFI